jgi:hypothetical protein
MTTHDDRGDDDDDDPARCSFDEAQKQNQNNHRHPYMNASNILQSFPLERMLGVPSSVSVPAWLTKCPAAAVER